MDLTKYIKKPNGFSTGDGSIVREEARNTQKRLKAEEEKFREDEQIYPNDFPKIAMGNNINLCATCEEMYKDPCYPSQPDFNYCQPMMNTSDTFKNLLEDEIERFDKLMKTEIQCPFYISKKK